MLFFGCSLALFDFFFFLKEYDTIKCEIESLRKEIEAYNDEIDKTVETMNKLNEDISEIETSLNEIRVYINLLAPIFIQTMKDLLDLFTYSIWCDLKI
jgi:uncharacterized coiled-coil DUF342 family protein